MITDILITIPPMRIPEFWGDDDKNELDALMEEREDMIRCPSMHFLTEESRNREIVAIEREIRRIPGGKERLQNEFEIAIKEIIRKATAINNVKRIVASMKIARWIEKKRYVDVGEPCGCIVKQGCMDSMYCSCSCTNCLIQRQVDADIRCGACRIGKSVQFVELTDVYGDLSITSLCNLCHETVLYN